MVVYSLLRKLVSRIARKAGLQRRPWAPPPDYLDAPITEAEVTYIPIDGFFLASPNYKPAFKIEQPEQVPLGDAIVTGKHGKIFQRGIWLMEFSWYGGLTYLSPSHRHIPLQDNVSPQPKIILGRATSTVPFWPSVYGHVLLDELPLLYYMLDSSIYKCFDKIIISSLASQLLNRCKHPDLADLRTRLVLAQPGQSYASTDFVALRRTGCLMNPSRQELDILNKICLTARFNENAPEPSRIFLQRIGEKRKIRNFAEIKKVLDRYDIEVVQATKMPNPWRLFAKAQLVVGVAGSDLSDSCFMSKESHLVEIHPTDHVYPYNWNVANTMGFNYHGMLEKSDIERGTPLQNGLSPITVDPLRLDKRLSSIVPMLTPRS